MNYSNINKQGMTCARPGNKYGDMLMRFQHSAEDIFHQEVGTSTKKLKL